MKARGFGSYANKNQPVLILSFNRTQNNNIFIYFNELKSSRGFLTFFKLNFKLDLWLFKNAKPKLTV